MKKVMSAVVWLILLSSALALSDIERSNYRSACAADEVRCAGIAIQKCINGKWFFDKVCSFGKVCDTITKTCVSEREKGPVTGVMTSLVKLPPCQDGQAVCERAHVLMFCNSNKWQRMTCKPGFRCSSRRAGCEPVRPYLGIEYQPKIQKFAEVQRGQSKYQPAVIKRYTYIRGE